jgi:SPOR domain
MSSVLAGGPPARADSQPPPAAPPPFLQGASAGDGPPQRGNAVTVIAGVGVLLLAMGVGVLIGRSGNAKQVAAPAQVISVAAPGAGASTGTTAGASFTGDWPSGSSGYTVQLQSLPESTTQVSAVEAAKAAASAKGAKGVGALKSEEFSSLTAGSYVIYAGVYSKRAEAQKALAALKKSFPGASVIAVNNRASSASERSATSSEGPSSASSSGAGSSESHPAPPSVLKGLANGKGKSYEEQSKNLPDVIETR